MYRSCYLIVLLWIFANRISALVFGYAKPLVRLGFGYCVTVSGRSRIIDMRLWLPPHHCLKKMEGSQLARTCAISTGAGRSQMSWCDRSSVWHAISMNMAPSTPVGFGYAPFSDFRVAGLLVDVSLWSMTLIWFTHHTNRSYESRAEKLLTCGMSVAPAKLVPLWSWGLQIIIGHHRLWLLGIG